MGVIKAPRFSADPGLGFGIVDHPMPAITPLNYNHPGPQLNRIVPEATKVPISPFVELPQFEMTRQHLITMVTASQTYQWAHHSHNNQALDLVFDCVEF